MDFAKIKKYPSQISTAFKRFPIASAFAVLSTIAFFIVYESIDTASELHTRFLFWLSIYPIAAMFISLSTSLVQESLKNTSRKPQFFSGLAWFAISWLLVLYPSSLNDYETSHVIGAIVFIYTTTIISLFVAPFFKQKNENAFWVHLTKTFKSLIVAAIVAGLLLLATELLLLGFLGLFGVEDPSEEPFFHLSIFCTCTVLPLLFFSTLPTFDECIKTKPTLSKFASSICRFLFIPVFTISLALFYGYILKFIILHDMPYEVVIWLVFAFTIYLLVLNLAMYPARQRPKPTLEKKLLKNFPIATLPLLILMTYSIFRSSPDRIDEDFIYILAINIFFYIAIAIQIISKIKCKSKYTAIAFCGILMIVTVGPLRASNLICHIWENDVKTTLIEEGFTNLPLSQEDCDSLLNKLAHKDFPKAARTIDQMQKLAQRDDKEFSKYVSATKIRIPHANEDAVITSIIDTKIDHSDIKIFEIPKGKSKVYRLAKSLNDNDIEYRNDTLFFKITPKTSDETYHFTVTRQALEDSTQIIDGQGAQIRLQELSLSIGTTNEKESRYLWIEGYMFME